MLLILLLTLGYLAYLLMAECDRPLAAEVPAGACRQCGQAVADDWLLCPRCRSSLREPCGGCDRSRRLDHLFCPWCGRPAEVQP